jgi:hypothetical protein
VQEKRKLQDETFRKTQHGRTGEEAQYCRFGSACSESSLVYCCGSGASHVPTNLEPRKIRKDKMEVLSRVYVTYRRGLDW